MSYSDVTGHLSMVFDATRNLAYEAAIKKRVTRDSVVLDLGAGLGIHGLMAARAGARKVFLVEPQNVVHAAMDVAKRNGLGDRVQVFQGRIEEIELPEKVDIITSVFTGNLLYSEDLLPSLYFARDRWLKPGGHLIPDRAELMVAVASAKPLHRERIQVWSDHHLGFDYSAIRRYAANGLLDLLEPSEQVQLLSAPAPIEAADFRTAVATRIDAEVQLPIVKAGICSGLASWLRIRLGDQWLSAGPNEPAIHWRPQLMPVDPEFPVRLGDVAQAQVTRPRGGDWSWRLGVGPERRTGSTFLSQPLLASRLRALAPGYQPSLSPSGRLRHVALGLFDGRRAAAEIADELQLEFPGQFVNREEAESFVLSLAAAYAS